jgi:group I intron endonuclease
MNSGIYKITQIDTGKIYIGQSINLKERKRAHKHAIKNYPLANAINKYGWGSFKFEVIVYAEGIDYLNYLEEQIIKSYDCLSPKGFNLRHGGNNSTFSEETKKKMSERKKEAIASGKCPKPMNMTGFKHSPETIEHLKKVHKGRKFSEETREKLRVAAIARWSDEMYRKKVLAAKGIS